MNWRDELQSLISRHTFHFTTASSFNAESGNQPGGGRVDAAHHGRQPANAEVAEARQSSGVARGAWQVCVQLIERSDLSFGMWHHCISLEKTVEGREFNFFQNEIYFRASHEESSHSTPSPMSSAASSQDSLHRHHHQQQQLAVIQGYGGYYAMPHGGGAGHSLPPGVVSSPVIAGSNAAAHAAAVAAAKNKNRGMKSTLGR